MELVLACLGFIFIIAVLTISTSLKIVPEHQRLVIFRLGRALENFLGPGIVFLIPVIDRAIPVDVREQVRDASNLPALTRDSRPITFSIRWKYKILDPVKSVLAVGNIETAAVEVIKTALEALTKDIDAAELSNNIEWVRSTVLARLGRVTEPWGMQITGFEILNVNE